MLVDLDLRCKQSEMMNRFHGEEVLQRGPLEPIELIPLVWSRIQVKSIKSWWFWMVLLVVPGGFKGW